MNRKMRVWERETGRVGDRDEGGRARRAWVVGSIDRFAGSRRLLVVPLVAIVWMLTLPAAHVVGANASGGSDAAHIRIAIAPFVGDQDSDAIAQLLSVRFARLGVERLLAPGSFVAERDFDPRADRVRTWAYQAAVDSVIVGRVLRGHARTDVHQVDAVVRSGHSGAELFRHAVHVPNQAGLGSALDRLAAAIVGDLGGDPSRVTAAERAAATPPVSAKPATDSSSEASSAPNPVSARAAADPAPPKPKRTEGSSAASSRGLETRLGVASFDRDSPIEIKAEQAEISADGEKRKLVFVGGVWVHQGNVTLTSDRLEADYEEGESEPSRLLASGRVRVEQADRAARCDRAEYLRATAQLTCRGRAELVQGCDVVRGERIVLDLAADKARVEGAASIVINPKGKDGAPCRVKGSAR